MSNHKWCRDVPRDEAVRAAEDAAAVPAIMHRDLPEVVADLRERVARVEAAVTPKSVSLSNAEGLRTERVTLEVTQRTESYAPLSEFDWTAMLRSACRGRLFDGESVRVVEADEIARLTAERDAARRERYEAREECERLSEWVPLRASMEVARLKARVAELEAAAPPRGWLTGEMRDDLDEALEWLNCQTNVFAKRAAAAIATTLARETPPRVKVPTWIHDDVRRCVIAAIRDAGGEVEG